jgi:hypothetical protein
MLDKGRVTRGETPSPFATDSTSMIPNTCGGRKRLEKESIEKFGAVECTKARGFATRDGMSRSKYLRHHYNAHTVRIAHDLDSNNDKSTNDLDVLYLTVIV